MPCDYSKYPPNWPELRAKELAEAGRRCQGTPRYPDCRAADREPHPVTGSRVVLTVAHMDSDVTNNEPANLRALCQRCHLTHDVAQHTRNRLETLRRRKAWAAVTAFLARPSDERQRMLF